MWYGEITMRTMAEKGEAFRALHERADAFIIPNPWDVGTARLLAHLGFEALATTSAGYAFSVGRPDSTVGREETLAHVAAIVSATDLPVSADLENGFGDAPEAAAETIALGAAAGLAGGSIEDLPGRSSTAAGAGAGVYEIAHASDRIRAAAEVVRNLPFRFTLTARAENFIAGNPDLKDTIARLQAYQEAGADVLYAPGLTSKNDIAAVVRAVDRPVNVVMGLQGLQLSLAELSALGVKRISVGSALSRAALGAFLRAAHELRDHGTFTFANDAVSYRDVTKMFESMR
jgi:2-methylisocitrate lyase-like PEP mutase family enzyme